MELTLLVILVGIAGSVLGRPPHQPLQFSTDSKQIAAYLIENVKSVEFYRQEVHRELAVLSRLVDLVRADPTGEHVELMATLVDTLADNFERLDQSLDVFMPNEIDITSIMSGGGGGDAADDESSSETTSKIAKRFAWPKRMYSAAAKYNKIPVIRTGK